MIDERPNFWRWLFLKDGRRKAGVHSLADRWLVLHVAVGIWASMFLGHCFVESSKSVIIPFASVLTGITFAWSGNITALLTTKELGKLAEYHKDGIAEYVFTVQRAILIIFVALMLWVLVGLDVISNALWRFVVFSISSAAVRESWGVIMFAQMLTIYRERVAKVEQSKISKNANDE